MKVALKKIKNNDNFILVRTIFIMFFLSRLFILFIAGIYNMVTKNGQDFTSLLHTFDSAWYTRIATNGYGIDSGFNPELNQPDWAFFPLYPGIVRYLWYILKIESVEKVSIIVSNIFAFLAGIMSYKYVVLTRKNVKVALLVTILLFFGPWTFYFAIGYTEALFSFLLISSFYFMKKKNYFVSALFIALTSATRVVGALLVFVLIYNIILNEYKGKSIKDFLKFIFLNPHYILDVLLCPFGTFSFMYLLYKRVGDPWAFMTAQKAWGRGTNGFNELKDCLLFRGSAMDSLIAYVIIVVLILYLALLFQKRYDEYAYMMVCAIIPLASGIHSMIRYFVGGYFVYIIIAELLEKNDKYKEVIMAIMLFMEGTLTFFWFSGSGFMI